MDIFSEVPAPPLKQKKNLITFEVISQEPITVIAHNFQKEHYISTGFSLRCILDCFDNISGFDFQLPQNEPKKYL